MAYLMQEHTAEEIAAEDPFGGQGLFLECSGADADEILSRLEHVYGQVIPAVAWPGRGAWVLASLPGMTRDEMISRWACARGRPE